MEIRQEKKMIEITVSVCECDVCKKEYYPDDLGYRAWYRMQFCSEACYGKELERRRQERIKKNSKKYIERRRERIAAETAARPDNVCEYCGTSFRPIRKTTKFCSPKCKQAAYRSRKENN
jgi:hypothetical protein